MTIKYNSNGIQQWVATYNGTGNGDDIAKSLKVAGGVVYVTGTSDGGFSNGDDIVTIAYYSINGREVWVSSYNNSTSDVSNDISVDTYRGVFITGKSGNNIITIRYDNSTGSQLWVKNDIIGMGNSIGLFKKPCVGDINCYTIDVFITGYTTISDILYGSTVKYDEDGNKLWNTVFLDATSRFEALAIDQSENVYVTGSGFVNDPVLGYGFITVSYNSIGEMNWTFGRTNGFGGTATGIVIDGIGNSYVTGIIANGVGVIFEDYLTIKYGPLIEINFFPIKLYKSS